MKSTQGIKTSSVATTLGVKVEVESRYLSEQSNPSLRRYAWAYTIRITNETDRALRLVARSWLITDATGHKEEVSGPGVVGEQPRLMPGEKFQYTSGCPLPTSQGRMEGRYTMVRDDGTEFDVNIAPFALELPFSVN